MQTGLCEMRELVLKMVIFYILLDPAIHKTWLPLVLMPQLHFYSDSSLVQQAEYIVTTTSDLSIFSHHNRWQLHNTIIQSGRLIIHHHTLRNKGKVYIVDLLTETPQNREAPLALGVCFSHTFP